MAVTAPSILSPPDTDGKDRLDWDEHLPTPPVRPGGTVTVRLVALGRGKPDTVEPPVTNPGAEE